jgi:hypothetical protein
MASAGSALANGGEPEPSKGGLKKLLRWTEAPLAIAGVITLAWSVLTFLLPANEFDAVVWVAKESALFPSEATDGRRVPFTFEGKPVTSAEVWQMRVTNEGKSFIGLQDRQWDLVLSHPAAEIVRVIDAPVASGARLNVSVAQSAAANEARVRMGALERRQTVEFRLLLLNASRPLRGGLRVSTTLEGIPGPLLTHRSPQERLSDRLVPFAFTSFVVLLGWAGVKELRQRGELRKPLALLKYAGMVAFSAVFASALVTQFLGWALWRFL